MLLLLFFYFFSFLLLQQSNMMWFHAKVCHAVPHDLVPSAGLQGFLPEDDHPLFIATVEPFGLVNSFRFCMSLI